jgi:hypothetical protein
VQTMAGVTLIVGSVLFLSAAFMPISLVYAESDPQEQVARVQDSRVAWVTSQALFALGSIVAAVGILLFARHVHLTDEQRALVIPAAYLAAALAVIGVGFWLTDLYRRVFLSPETLFLDAGLQVWMFLVYTVLTQAALLLLGFVLLRSGYPGWMGWGLLAAVGLTIVMLAILRDVPPLFHYLWMLVLGIMLVRLD